MNINTKEYWDKRFLSGDWEDKRGRRQTKQFAESQVHYFKIAHDFAGVILDFGCGLGDAMPVYRATYPNASLIGIDISEAAIVRCREIYGDYATFIQGDHTKVPKVDVIIASNVFEHLSNDIEIAIQLLTKCKDLYIIVPYRENVNLGNEHIRSYDKHHFRGIGNYDFSIFFSKGWGSSGWKSWIDVYLKNILRSLFGRKIVHASRQIMYHFATIEK